MSTYNNLNYRKMPQQVQKNREDIVTISTLYDDDIAALQEKDTEQDGVILDNSDDIEQLQDALASGGVIVTRKAGLSVDLATVLAETKIVFDVEVEATNDITAMTKDANNDTVLITEGKYNVEFPITVTNGSGAAQTCTITMYVKDSVTDAETLLKTVVIALTGGETVNTKPQVDYTRIAGNNQIIIFKQQSTIVSVEIKDNTETHITSYFTTAGTGVVTQTRNIAPTTVADEGLAGTEATQSEINEGFKTRHDTVYQAVQGSGNNLLMTNSGLIKNVADPIDNQDVVTKAYFVANPTGIPYVTDNMAPDVAATESIGAVANQSLINIEGKDYREAQERRTILFDSSNKQLGNGGTWKYGQTLTFTDTISGYTNYELTLEKSGYFNIIKVKRNAAGLYSGSVTQISATGTRLDSSISLLANEGANTILFDGNRQILLGSGGVVWSNSVINDNTNVNITRVVGIIEVSIL